jgi:prepilin-type N-terminal cleavage/methylation domain-containing protein
MNSSTVNDKINTSHLSKMRGFTIVELLIVIVVIGILAAIVIVAYNGIQDRAKNTKYQTDAKALQKGAEAVNADLGSYPKGTTTADLISTTNSTTVVGFNATTTFKIPSGVSVVYSAVGAVPTNAAATTAADGSPRTYTVTPCTTAGVKIYYPVRGGALATLLVGDTTTC